MDPVLTKRQKGTEVLRYTALDGRRRPEEYFVLCAHRPRRLLEMNTVKKLVHIRDMFDIFQAFKESAGWEVLERMEAALQG
ncbi:hypothetical protein BGX24_011983, partial [Mortierella sp. AD032]